MIGALPQTPEFIAFVFPKMGRKNRRQKSAAHFGVKSVQPLRSHSCVAVSCRTEKANYIINNCLEDYSIYTVCATLPIEDNEWSKIHKKYNVMLERKLRMNFRLGYWEIAFYHTKPLSCVPKDMRMC